MQVATTHYATTNKDGTITTKSVTFGPKVATTVSTSTHNPDMWNRIFGTSWVNKAAIITIILDDTLMLGADSFVPA